MKLDLGFSLPVLSVYYESVIFGNEVSFRFSQIQLLIGVAQFPNLHTVTSLLVLVLGSP